MGAGYYVNSAHPKEVDDMDEDDLTEKIIEQDSPAYKPKTNLLPLILAPINSIAITNERTKRIWYDQFKITNSMRQNTIIG